MAIDHGGVTGLCDRAEQHGCPNGLRSVRRYLWIVSVTRLSSSHVISRRPGGQTMPRNREHREGVASGTPGSTTERSDVLVSAVISTYLLTHLHHVLQRAEYKAQQEGQTSLAANYAQLRQVLCLDASSMDDASTCDGPGSDAPQAV